MKRLKRISAKQVLGTATVVLALSSVGFSQVRQAQIVDKVEHESDLRVASQCVASHERLAQIRAGDVKTYRRNAETLLSFAEPGSENAKRYQEQVELDVKEISGTIDDPDCDLEAAKRELES